MMIVTHDLSSLLHVRLKIEAILQSQNVQVNDRKWQCQPWTLLNLHFCDISNIYQFSTKNGVTLD